MITSSQIKGASMCHLVKQYNIMSRGTTYEPTCTITEAHTNPTSSIHHLVFLLSAVPLSLHRITFLILLITCVFIFLVDILEESERKIHNHCSIISVL